MRSAASGVRLASLRVCSIHSAPFSTVNSKSCASWKSASSRCADLLELVGESRDGRDGPSESSADMATGNDVLPLRVEEEVDVEAVLSRRRVPREADARTGSHPHVAEDHRLDGRPRFRPGRRALANRR